ncbi:ABC transporter permease subunit [Actinotalea sp. M2MS4P-6]|uniref:ABC transporter permease n=1 Tax=Actinotalea sp. M2MS4P-6 TaxID=2983762 RepID=UPI0021E391D6|nr:ABC transporter permease subunit [Actinotalea sp. M2MS4P-6]MCV2393844.1 ABC transporter permease subunit [Actinotalea sp. M2MS4P-6]
MALAWWLAVWQVAAMAIGHGVLLVGPVEVARRLAELVPTAEFWATVGRTTGRITLGFAAAAVLGVLTAAASARSRWLEAVIGPAVVAIRSTPVVSFIILVLIWVDSARLATIISFLMALPIVHATVYQGIRQRPRELLEMAAVFRVPRWRRMLAVDVPAVLPYFVAACRTGVGLAWKSGIAAEVIGLPSGTIGERLYQAKIFLATADVLAWTVVVVLVAYLVEQAIVRLLEMLEHRLSAGASGPLPVGGRTA